MGKRNKHVALTLFIILSLLFSNLGIVSGQSSEKNPDIASSWAKDPLSRWLDQGLISGYADNTFKPENTISRAEFVTMINRIFGFSEQGQEMFKDVSKDQWYYADIAKAKYAGYISGFEDGSFKPDAKVNRQEAAKMIYDLMKLNNKSKESVLSVFQDADQIPTWSTPYLNAVNAAGYMNGYPDQTLRPLQAITRAEAVVLLDKAVGTLIRTSTPEDEAKEKTISGNVTINTAGVTLKNTIIEGDLHLAAGIGEGEVFLDHVTVKGRTLIAGGGENSVILNNSTLNEALVDKIKGKVRLLTKGDTVILKTIIKSAVKLQEETKDKGFVDVEILSGFTGENVQLQGEFNKVWVRSKAVLDILKSTKIDNLEIGVDAEESTVNMEDQATLTNVVLNAAAAIKGSGVIKYVLVLTNGSTIEQVVEHYELGNGVVVVIINGNEVTENSGSTGSPGTSVPPQNSDTNPVPNPSPSPNPNPIPNPNPDPDNLLPEVEGGFIIGDKVYSYFANEGDYSNLDLELVNKVTKTVYEATYASSSGNIGEFHIEDGFIPASNYIAVLFNESYYTFGNVPMLGTVSVNDAVYAHVYYDGTESISYRINNYMVTDLADQLPEEALPLVNGDQMTLFYGDQLSLQAVWNGIANTWTLISIRRNLDTPKNVTAQPLTDTEIQVQWEAASGADHYYIYYSDAQNGSYVPVMNELNEKMKVNGTSFIDNNNLPHTTKYFKVTAGKDGSDQESPYSETVVATTYYNKHFALNFTVTDTVQHPSEPIIYMSDKVGKKVYAFNYETKEITSVAFNLPPESITYANGELFVSLLKMEHTSYASVESGAIAIVNASNLTITQTLDIDLDPYDIAVDPNGAYIYVSSGSRQWTNVKSYSRATLLEVEASQIRQQSYIHMHPKMKKLYAISTESSPRDISAYNLDLTNGQFVEASYPGGYDSPYHGEYTMNTNMKLSPDGQYIFNGAGTVFNTTNSKYDDMGYVYRLSSSFTDMAFDLGNSQFYTVNNAIVGVYGYRNFKQTGLYHTDGIGKGLFNGNDRIIALSTLGNKSIVEFIEKSSLENVAPPQNGLGIQLSGTIADVAYDTTSNKAYAIDEAFKKLMVIDLETQTVTQTLELPYKPSGVTVSEDRTKLFIVNRDENNLVTEVSLSNLQISRHLAYAAAMDSGDSSDRHIYNKAGKLYVVIGDWAPKLLEFDATTFANVNYGTEIVSVGDMTFSSDNSKFYTWFQYGWDAGNAGSDVYAYAINGGGTTLTQIDKSVLGYPNMLRDPLDTPIFLVEGKGIIIAKNKVLSSSSLDLLGSFAEPIYAVSPDGTKAVGKAGIYDTSTYAKIANVSLTGAREMFFDKDGILHYLIGDVLYSN